MKRQARVIIICCLVCLLLAVAATLLMRSVYEAQASIFAQSQNSTFSLPGDIAGLLGKSSSDPVSYAVAVLQSDDFARRVLKHLDLTANRNFTDGEKLPINLALVMLKGMVKAEDNGRGLVTITARAHTKQLCATIANTYVELFLGSVNKTNKSKRLFIEGKIEQFEDDLKTLEQRLAILSEQNAIVNLPEQTRTAVEQMATLEGNLQKLDADLEGVRSEMQNAGNPQELAALKMKASSLEAQRGPIEAGLADLQGKLKDVPRAALEQARLQREIDLKSKLFQALSQQHQVALIDEQSSAGVYRVVDRAYPPAFRVKPRLSVNLAIGLLVGLFLAVAINMAVSELQSR